ncbi:MAG TPA: GNAT family N-acetyltransferase [Dehalococcoidia bacterium]|nr:GNAT family N-acetyltransferase [Dehalococcoidia bacterium]
MVEIRPGRHADHDAVQRLWRESGMPAATESEWAALCGGGSASLLVAEDDGRVVGAAVVAYDGWRAFVSHVAVAPEARRSGIGSRLLAEAERQLKERGAPLVFALVKESMTDGLALLGASGYEPEGDIAFVKPLGGKRTWPRLVSER